MNSELWNEVQDAYAEALRLPPEDRTSFLNSVYGGRPEIHKEVESLLQFQSAADEMTQSTILATAANMFGDEDEDLIGCVVGGKYLVRSCLGAGNMGEVYLADHMTLDTPFALKRPARALKSDPEFRRRLLDEARRAVQLKHDNVARVHDIIESGEDLFLVMEYIEGETLRARMKSLDRPIQQAEFLSIAVQCASALAAAHEKRIVHLDVKPENIMLTPSGQVKICDFGVARKLSASSAEDTRTSEGRWTFAGTPAYMAPEVILSYQFDERADQFSLGIVLYEMLTGRNPFLAESVVATTARVVKETPLPIRDSHPGIDPKIERIVIRLLSKEPEARYASAAELVTEFESVRLHDRGDKTHTRWLKLAAAILLVSLAIVPAGLLYKNGTRSGVGLTPLPEKKILVVLPFRVIDNSPGQRNYSDGVSEIVIAKLAQLTTQISNLQVVPASEIRDRKIETAERARAEFGATIVMAGTFQLSGDFVRISYSLIDAVNHKELRGGSKQVAAGDPFAVQDAVTADLAELLELALSPPARQNIRVFGTTHPEAYFLYTEGRGALRNYQVSENVDIAIDRFRLATERDPVYASAYAALGESYWRKFMTSSERNWLDQARLACEKSATVDQQSADAHACLGLVDQSRGDYERAVEDFRRAIQFDPTNDTAQSGLGSALEARGDLDEAEKAYLKAIEIRPQYWAGYMRLAAFYRNRRHDYGKAIENCYKALAASPGNGQVYFSLGAAYIDDGQYEKAVSTLLSAAALRPSWGTYYNLGIASLRARRYPDAIRWIEKANTINRDYRGSGTLARAYWLSGDAGKAAQTYERGIQEGEKLLEVNPRDADVHLLVGRYYAMLGKKPEARSHLTLALNASGNDPHYLVIASVAYLRLGDKNSALNLMDQALAHGARVLDIRAEPELDELAGDPRYIALVAANQARH